MELGESHNVRVHVLYEHVRSYSPFNYASTPPHGHSSSIALSSVPPGHQHRLFGLIDPGWPPRNLPFTTNPCSPSVSAAAATPSRHPPAASLRSQGLRAGGRAALGTSSRACCGREDGEAVCGRV